MSEAKPRRFRKRPVEIEAIQFDGGNFIEIEDWSKGGAAFSGVGELLVRTLEGDLKASPGDWIIRGVHGEYYPCKPAIFETTYEAIEETKS